MRCVCVRAGVGGSLNETAVAPDARSDRSSKFYYHMRILFYIIILFVRDLYTRVREIKPPRGRFRFSANRHDSANTII